MMQFDLFSRLCSKPYSKDLYFGKYIDIEGKRKKRRRNCLDSIQRSPALNGIVVKSQSALCT